MPAVFWILFVSFLNLSNPLLHRFLFLSSIFKLLSRKLSQHLWMCTCVYTNFQMMFGIQTSLIIVCVILHVHVIYFACRETVDHQAYQEALEMNGPNVLLPWR